MARRGAKGEPGQGGQDEISLTVECLLEEAKIQGEKEFTISPKLPASRLVAYARAHFGLAYDRGCSPGSMPRRDWRLVHVGGERDQQHVPKRLPSVKAAGIDGGERLRLVYVQDDADSTRSQTPQTSPSVDSLDVDESHHRSRHHRGKKRQHKHHDSPSEASCPAVAAEMEDAVDGVLEDGVPSGGEEAKESQKPVDNSASGHPKSRSKRAKVSAALETPVRRSARVRGIEPNVPAEPARGLPIRSSGMEAVVGTEEKEAVEGEVTSPMAAPQKSIASRAEDVGGDEEGKADVGKDPPSMSSSVEVSETASGHMPVEPTSSGRVSAAPIDSSTADEEEENEEEVVHESGELSRTSNLQDAVEDVEASSPQPEGSSAKARESIEDEVFTDSLYEDLPPVEDWLLQSPHVKLRYKAQKEMHSNQFAKAVETYRESLAAADDGTGRIHWKLLYDCRYQMILCLLELQRYDDCVEEARTNVELCLANIQAEEGENADHRRLSEARSMLGDFLLLSGRVEEAQMVLKLVVGAGTSGVLPKLSYIVSLCGGLESPQPIETCPLALREMQGVVREPNERLDRVVSQAKTGNVEKFSSALRVFLFDLGEDLPLPRVQEALFRLLGSQAGERGWGAAAKLKALLGRLDGLGQPLRSFQEFKSIVQEILDGPCDLQQHYPGIYAFCTKLCKGEFDKLCRAVEVSTL
ncbi:hypothetical protein Pmar_PMAR026028 [Perkinsus marinus ATCC 50983]|uniref:Uncharacterized protein n=1 Tax=Perkinsus marinus (strain ATCC 50983 / TXsc) TaxID=423536 RepID=C5LK82_PERM5|nr:hypothetical protein Pmar_PMAR026028 [Perkinsus marinus ATCC 50983]EER02869.1 hypothetical protein Pmar_PMAR026028 [Perkinsus marinus ATCC 50983]|eukprot:XP_002771053.1 hypothetical protein Pmar_PMAR026028 [Perkinsus marinus ATCC 50983]